ncbi:hypothetical protein [Virgibacillus chiguensis]|uniref:Protein gp8 n=1 Tax=Virgibacillus chiguensis TaxID=411959 RepID=A0A1M5XQ25_9BACI|nr:hypothetical protein [Virgibacillus chiguensis]SHI01859.1 hypothetical protein SAMN05421807_1329 [Virgibacillus chiguensis]
MNYLTYDEFKEISEVDIEESTFKSLIKKASAVLNAETSYFYVKNDITKDNEWRVTQFKQALCAQIEFFYEIGATTFEGINKSPQSFSAGRTTVTNKSRSSSGGKSLVAEDVYIYLEGTGLLFSGVSVW